MNKINRRYFLASLAALGAALVLPVNATPKQVNETWARFLADPWYFVVDEHGTIIEPDVPEPKTRADVFDVDLNASSPQDLIDSISDCEPLVFRFQQLADDERLDLENLLDCWEIRDDQRPKARVERLAEALQDADEGWKQWLLLEGKTGLERFLCLANGWLDEPVSWDESDWFKPGWSGQSAALSFFRDMDSDLLAALGVVIIEGEHPGSSYYAVELRKDVALANVAAEREALPFRFRLGVDLT